MYSFGIKAPLLKLPPNLMEVADNIRKDFVRQHIVNNQVAIDYIYAHQSQIHTDLGAGLSESEFKVPKEAFTVSRDIIEALFHQNRKHPLRLTVSEFADIFAIDHLTGNLSFLMQMLEKYPDLNFTARTKSANVDEMVMYNGFGRVSVNMGLNTQHVIDTYEHGTSSLEERIEAAVKIQKAKGIDLGIIIEPMIMYEGCEEDYTKLIDYTMLKLDPTKIKSISIGSVRYRPQLRSAIQKHFPNTTLFDASQQLQNPAHDDKRYRYPVDVRVRLYSMMRDRIAQYTNAPVKLGAENPEVWEKLGMSSTETIGETVFQYSPNVTIPTTKERKKIVKKMKEPKRVKRMVKEVAAVVRERMMKGVKEKQ
jgi:DNA repair photolyase